jgi:RND family efflux transporter MFP subunit
MRTGSGTPWSNRLNTPNIGQSAATPSARRLLALLLALGCAAAAAIPAKIALAAESPVAKSAGRPALAVALTTPLREDWPLTISANGNVAAWQEAVIGPEIGGQRLAEVLVNVGDEVRKGQLLARIAGENLGADLAQSRAAVAEAEATAAEATANAARARQLKDKGFYSPQQASQVATAEQTALARLASARARMAADELRLSQTRVLAPDGGTISARSATVGSLAQPGQELFRLVRGNRLEWRAEVTAAEFGRITPGMRASLQLPGQGTARIEGKVRAVAPTVDPQTRNAIVYVDLPGGTRGGARAGMYARGEFDAGHGAVLTLPQSAVLLRDGFSYVYRVDANSQVSQVKVVAGRRRGERIAITEGLDAAARVVASGVGFLADGDLVRVTGQTAR